MAMLLTYILMYTFILGTLPLNKIQLASTLNAVVCSVFAIYTLSQRSLFFTSSSCDTFNTDVYRNVTYSFMGYLTADLIMKKIRCNLGIDMVIHHVANIAFCLWSYSIESNCYIGVTMYLFEISTIPLSIRHMSNPEGKTNKIASIVFAISFTIFRIIWGLYVILSGVLQLHEGEAKNYITFVVVLASSSLNFIWFGKIYKMVMK